MSFHKLVQNDTTRFDVHAPYRLCTDYPGIPGGLGVVLPGCALHLGSPMVAAYIRTANPPAPSSSSSSISSSTLNQEVPPAVRRCAPTDARGDSVRQNG